MPSEKTYDLHGVKAHPFPGFDEEAIYLERVTLTTAASAREAIAAECLMDPEEIHPSRIYMRWATMGSPDSDGQISSPSEFPCWLECRSDHPDAVPFWKDAP